MLLANEFQLFSWLSPHGTQYWNTHSCLVIEDAAYKYHVNPIIHNQVKRCITGEFKSKLMKLEEENNNLKSSLRKPKKLFEKETNI